MVEFVHDAGGQADLVAVGTVSRRGGGHDLALGQFSGNGLGQGLQRIRSACNAHRGIDIGPAGQRIPDGAADTGGRSAERFDLGRMVVRFVLEQKKPVLILSVHTDLDLDRAGVDLFGLVELVQLSGRAEIAHSGRGDIHQVNGFGPAELFPDLQIFTVGLFRQRILKGHVVQCGQECGVAAVIRPVRIDHTDLGQGRVALFRAEVCLTESQVICIHRKAEPFHKRGQLFGFISDEPGQGLDGRGNGGPEFQGFKRFQSRQFAFHRVDHIMLDPAHLIRIRMPGEHIDPGRFHQRSLLLADELDALGRAVRPLVKLTGQVGYGEHGISLGSLQRRGDHIQLRLGKHVGTGGLEQFCVDALHVVAVHDPDRIHRTDPQCVPDLLEQRPCLLGKLGFLFNKYAVDHIFRTPF